MNSEKKDGKMLAFVTAGAIGIFAALALAKCASKAEAQETGSFEMNDCVLGLLPPPPAKEISWLGRGGVLVDAQTNHEIWMEGNGNIILNLDLNNFSPAYYPNPNQICWRTGNMGVFCINSDPSKASSMGSYYGTDTMPNSLIALCAKASYKDIN